ncbi:MAG: hypothetical protein PHT95_08000, partial [Candidatus Omnitrophica bacterium]|nr:hypothetical protein [Candidatus Omnitrophota bacterium]
MKTRENGMVIKGLSVLLSVLLVLEQTAWGADIIDAGYGPGKSTADEIMTGYDPEYSGERVSAKDSLLENMNSAENFVNTPSGEETRLITSTGCEIYFKDDEISRVLRPDGSTVTFETIKDAGGEVVGLKLKDGPVERIYNREGDLVSEIHRSEDGEQTEIMYENGVLADIRSGVMAMEDISISGSGDIESFSLMDSGGSAYFFSGGSLSSFRDANNAEYVFGADGALAWVNIKDKGESYRVKTIVSGGKETRTLTEIRKGDSYVFTDGNLISVTMSSGERAEYSYDTLERLSALKVYNRDILTDTYTYLYRGDETVITDGFGTIRSYDPSGRAIELKNCYGETYTYSYETDASGAPVTVVNYSVKKYDNGDTLYYVRGKLMKVERPDGSVIENIELDPELGSITAFSLKTTEGKTRNIRLAGSLVIVELSDQSRLVFRSGELIAMANSQGHVILSDDPGLRDIGIFDDKRAAAETNDALVTSALWRPQTTSNSKGITHLEMDHCTGEWTVESDIVAGSADRSSGEMYLDLRYDIPGVNGGPALDLRGMEISFLIKADLSLVPAGGKPCELEVFAKDSSWKTQYGVKAELTVSGEWFKVTLVPTQGAIGLGYTDPGFDPSSIVMIGLRLSAPGTASKGSMYRGTLTVKHDVMPDLVPGNDGNNVLDDFYRELGIRRDIKRLYANSGGSEEGPLEAFAEAMGSVPEDGPGRELVSKVVFHAENSVPHIKGIVSAKFDPCSGEYAAAADLSSSAYGKKEGEVYFDLTKDIPGLDWTDAVNLTGQTLRMLIKAPEALAAGGSSPNGARVFVVDENGNKQYGTWVNFKEGEVWYALDLTPTFGNVPMGSTQ